MARNKGSLYIFQDDIPTLQEAASDIGIMATRGSASGRAGSASGLIQMLVAALHNDREQTLALLRSIQVIATKDQDHQEEVPPEPP